MSDQTERELNDTKAALAGERRNHRVFVWLVFWVVLWRVMCAFSTGDGMTAVFGWVSAFTAWWISGRLLPPIE